MKNFLFRTSRLYKGCAPETSLFFESQDQMLNLLASFKDSRNTKCSGSISKESVSKASRILSNILKVAKVMTEPGLLRKLQPAPLHSPPDL